MDLGSTVLINPKIYHYYIFYKMAMHHLTGRAIGEGFRHNFGRITSLGFGTEILYSFVIIVCSLMIFYGTKELYELSSHKGIKYFRQAFLFFALAYFFRSFIKFGLIYFNVGAILDISPRTFGFVFGHITLLFFMYFSSMAIFYLLYSVMWKKWEGDSKRVYLFHTLAIVIAIISILIRNPFVYFEINIFLLFVVLFVVYTSYQNKQNKKRGYNLYLIYVLLLLFWILNIIDILIPKFFQGFQLLIYLASSGVFLFILYKVIKNVGAD